MAPCFTDPMRTPQAAAACLHVVVKRPSATDLGHRASEHTKDSGKATHHCGCASGTDPDEASNNGPHTMGSDEGGGGKAGRKGGRGGGKTSIMTSGRKGEGGRGGGRVGAAAPEHQQIAPTAANVPQAFATSPYPCSPGMEKVATPLPLALRLSMPRPQPRSRNHPPSSHPTLQQHRAALPEACRCQTSSNADPRCKVRKPRARSEIQSKGKAGHTCIAI